MFRMGLALACGGVSMTLPPGIKLRGGKLSCQIQLPSGRTWRTLPTADPVQAAALKNLAQQKALQGIDYLGVVDDVALTILNSFDRRIDPQVPQVVWRCSPAALVAP